MMGQMFAYAQSGFVRICRYRIALDATLIDKGMVTQGQHGERQTVLDEALGMLRVGGPTLIVPSMAHLALSVGKLARLVEQYFGDGHVCSGVDCGRVDTRTDNGRFVLHLLRTLYPVGLRGAHNGEVLSRLALRQNRSRFAQLGMSGLAQKSRPAKA